VSLRQALQVSDSFISNLICSSNIRLFSNLKTIKGKTFVVVPRAGLEPATSGDISRTIPLSFFCVRHRDGAHF